MSLINCLWCEHRPCTCGTDRLTLRRLILGELRDSPKSLEWAELTERVDALWKHIDYAPNCRQWGWVLEQLLAEGLIRKRHGYWDGEEFYSLTYKAVQAPDREQRRLFA